MKIFLYKARRSLFAALLITLSIGSCYAFSLFSQPVQDCLGISRTAAQFAFCLNIGFLGLGAACFGSFVEKNIKFAAAMSTALFCSGFALAGLSTYLKNLPLFYLGFGVLAGLGEGVGYVTPVKNLLLFFGKSGHKALITAISIVTFGLGSSVCSVLFKYVYPEFGIGGTFFFFAALYLIMMTAGSIMIDKPKFAKLRINASKKYSAAKYLTDRYFIQCWLFMFLNISMGLVIIGRCACMLAEAALPVSAVVMTMTLCGLSNGFGRVIFPAISDYIKRRTNILLLATGLEIASLAMALIDPWFLPISFIIINGCYGCFFAMLPSVLSDRYGNSELSFIHGLCLQSWGEASVFAFLVSTFVLSVFSLGMTELMIVLTAVYALNYVNIYLLPRK